jgi:hypothetical protein
MSNPQKVPNIVVSLLNRPKEEAIAYVNAGDKNSSEYMFRLANDNIVSFSHSYNFDKGDGDNIGNLITLELIDPENVFEYTIFSNYDLLTKNQKQIAEMRKASIAELNRLIGIRNILKDYFAQTTQITATVNNTYNLTDTELKESAQERVTGVLGKELTDLFKTTNDSDLIPFDLAEKIINKIREKKLINFSFDVKDTSVTASGLIPSGAFDNLVSDLNLDNLEQKLQITPTPYFYFYYGLNDNPNEWTGPVAAQFTDAKYDYSYESGRKSITMKFTTTFDWPAFSKLALDVRGFTTTRVPIYRSLGDLKLETIDLTNATTTKNASFFELNTVLVETISEYIKDITSDTVQVLVILPDLDKIIQNSFTRYSESLVLEGATFFNQSAFRLDAYARLLNDMGFSTNYYEEPVSKKISAGDIIPNDVKIDKNFGGYAQGALIDKANIPQKQKLILGVGISKDINESFRDPLQKIITGIKNKTTLIDPAFEVIDDMQFVKEFVEHLQNINSPYRTFSPDKPIVVFGDRYIIEKYLYGKKFYILNGIVQEGRTTTEAENPNQPLADFNSYVARNFAKNSGDDLLPATILHMFDSNYINNIASKYFLKVDTCKKVNSSLYTSPTDVLSIDNKAVLEKLEVARIPIFKSGVKESNVLNIDLNFNDFYFVALKSVWSQSETLNLVSNDSTTTPPVNTNQLNSFDEKELDRIRKQAKEISIAKNKDLDIVELFQFIDTDSGFSTFKNKTDVEKGEELQLLLKIIQQENQNLKIIVGSHENINSYLTMLSLFSTLVNRAYQGVVKTLPFFHISGTALSTPPILLLLEEVNTPPYKSKGFITRALNGLYQIRGFKHTISTEDICSEFYIVKSIQLDMPISFGGRGQ